jgi:hypothetical protein
MSSQFFENSRIRAGRTEDKLEWPLAPTIAPWKIAGNPPTKIFAMRGPVSQYKYGTGYDTSEWPDDWQKAFVTSPESGLIVTDRDADGFEELMARCGIPLSPLFVLTGRDGGIHYYYDGRHLSRSDWPGQRTLYAADGVTKVGDVKSNGFVPAPGSINPNGREYRLGPDSARGFDHMLPWLAEWTGWLDADQEAAGRRRPASWASTTGSGRNNLLYQLKKRLFWEEGLDEDDPEMHRRIYEANDQFDVPLDEEEVRLTVLKTKGWKRHVPAGAVEISSARLRQYRAQEASRAGQQAEAATPPLTRDSHLPAIGEKKERSDDREVRIAGQEACGRIRKVLRRRKEHLAAIDPQALWPCRADAAATTKALHAYILDLGIEQGTHLITWAAANAADAIGAGVSTVYRHLRRLEHHGQLRILGEGRICIEVSRRSLFPRRRKAGETVGKDEAVALVRKEMQAAVTRPCRISQRELLELTQNEIAWAHLETCVAQGRSTPAPRMTIYRVRQALGVLQDLGEFTKIAPALPEEKAPGVWRSDPSAWAPGRVAVPKMPKRLRPRGLKQAYLEMAFCSPCTPGDLREAA